jgi:hypothetical protein
MLVLELVILSHYQAGVTLLIGNRTYNNAKIIIKNILQILATLKTKSFIYSTGNIFIFVF